MADEGITPEEFATWLTPRQALGIAKESLGITDNQAAAKQVLQQVKGDLIKAARASSARKTEGKPTVSDTTPRVISSDLWREYSETRSDFWNGSVRFAFSTWDRHSTITTDTVVDCFGLKLKPDDVHRQFPTTPAPAVSTPAPQAVSPASTRGAPRAAHWDDVIIEMCRRIHYGSFKPRRQADIERAILDWGRDNNIEISEAAARDRAKKIWKALMEEG